MLLYHLSPKKNRRSIARNGLRKGSWLCTERLILWALEHVSKHQKCKPDYLDVWLIDVSPGDIVRAGGKPAGKYRTAKPYVGAVFYA